MANKIVDDVVPNHLTTFVGYVEVTPECKLTEYNNQITQIKDNNNVIAITISQF